MRGMIAYSETISQKKVVKIVKVRTVTPVNGDKTTAKSFRKLHIRRRVQFSDIIIYENWMTGVMEQEKFRETARCRRPRWLLHHS